MSSKGRAGRYAVGIGSGAAAGAAAGSSVLPGWGTLIGGVVGGVGGAIGAGVNEGNISDADAKLREQQQRERDMAITMIRRRRAQELGADTRRLDYMLADEAMDTRHLAERKAFDDATTTLDPNAFVGMAVNGTRAAGSIYDSMNKPSMGGGVPTLNDPGQYTSLNSGSAYQLDKPQLLQDDDQYSLDPRRFSLTGGFR